MSYDIAVVNREFAMTCRKENIDFGQVLEENPEIIPDLDESSKNIIKNFLLFQDNYKIEKVTEKETVFSHKSEKSVQGNLGKKMAFFKSGFSDTWTILSTTALLTVEPEANIMRYDFQDGHWG